jgi:hypothetical protein
MTRSIRLLPKTSNVHFSSLPATRQSKGCDLWDARTSPGECSAHPKDSTLLSDDLEKTVCRIQIARLCRHHLSPLYSVFFRDYVIYLAVTLRDRPISGRLSHCLEDRNRNMSTCIFVILTIHSHHFCQDGSSTHKKASNELMVMSVPDI